QNPGGWGAAKVGGRQLKTLSGWSGVIYSPVPSRFLVFPGGFISPGDGQNSVHPGQLPQVRRLGIYESETGHIDKSGYLSASLPAGTPVGRK
ncbi:unnamed protein product, partial [marine sediment metagenome]